MGISPKGIVTVRLEFELSYFETAVQNWKNAIREYPLSRECNYGVPSQHTMQLGSTPSAKVFARKGMQ